MSAALGLRIHPADDMVIARHQLVGGRLLPGEGVTVIGLVPPGHLGCETNQISGLMEQESLATGTQFHTFNIQETGGSRKRTTSRASR
jgi:altronate hydrolase